MHISFFYRHVKQKAAVNWVLVNANSSSGLKNVKKKKLWDSKLTFLLTAIGYVVRLGNVWCFSTGHKGGGG